MFFSAEIKSDDIAETIHRADATKACAETLREECKNVKFGLKGSFNSAEDMDISYSNFT